MGKIRGLGDEKKPGGALHATLLPYGFDLDPEAGPLLGGDWQDRCAGFTSRRADAQDATEALAAATPGQP